MQTKKMSLANMQGKMNRNEMKQILGGVELPATSYTCSGEGFGSETYSVTSQQEAQQMAIGSIIAGQCWSVTSIHCSPNYSYWA